MDKRELGYIGEGMATELLRRKGYEILQRNYRCTEGEIDIIAQRYGELCFIEVKTRQNLNYGRPCESVTREKKLRIKRAAYHYLEDMKARGYIPRRIDFQIIEIVAQHHVNAF